MESKEELKNKSMIQDNPESVITKLTDVGSVEKKSAIESIVIDNIQNFIATIDDLINNKKFTFFRGDKLIDDFQLVPKIYKSTYSKISQYEKDMLTDFTFLSASKSTVTSRLYIEEMLDAQHYGLPTRLLDWSESALIALYFAVNPSKEYPNSDSVIWALNPEKLNKMALPDSSNEIKGALPIGSSSDKYDKLINEYYTSSKEQLYPIAIKTRRINPRIEAQRGVFLLYCINDNKKCLTKYQNSNEFLIQIVIKHEVAKIMHKQLQSLGVTHYQIFPEINSIAQDIQNVYGSRD